jgi:hypothetical protein
MGVNFRQVFVGLIEQLPVRIKASVLGVLQENWNEAGMSRQILLSIVERADDI